MVKSILALLPALLIFFPVNSENIEEKVKINHVFPEKVKAGEEFTITAEITNISISGVVRLQHFLPPGFLVEEEESRGADFMYEENNVKLIWSKFPSDKKFTISFKIKTEENLTGNLIINSEFVFQQKGKTEKLTLKPVEIFVTDQELTNETQESKPQILRRLLSVMPEKGEYKVEIVIRTNNLNEPAQFTDEIPADYTAEVLNAQGADFKFENHAVLFDWKVLPPNETFTISYMIKSGTAGPSPVINGVFVYGDLTMGKPAPKEISVSNEPFQTEEETFAPAESQSVNNLSKTPVSSSYDIAKTADVNTESQIQPSSPILKAETGITFKVQVAATQKSSIKNSYWFDSTFRLREDVELTYHEGWKKYIIGSFLAYHDATKHRIETQDKIPGAFVVAYENGMRIPVSEAVKNKPLNQ